MPQVTIIADTQGWTCDLDLTEPKFATSTIAVGYAYSKGEGEESWLRAAIRWSLADLPSGETVTKVELEIQCPKAGGSAHLCDIHPYDNNGQTEPCSEDGYIFLDHCNPPTVYINDTTAFRAEGVYRFDLGAQACIDVQNAKSAVNRFSLGFHEEGDNDPSCDLWAYRNGQSAKLIITYGEAPPPAGYSYSDGLVTVQVAG